MFRPVLGGSHIHCENWPVPVFASCYENPIGSYIYIYIYLFTGENQPGYQDFKVFHIHPVLK
jgi:hypothetical protein